MILDALMTLSSLIPQPLGPSRQQLSETPLVDGWDIYQWGAWGRRKSAIATAVCKQNGKFKAEIDMLKKRVAELGGQCEGMIKTTLKDDPFLTSDPWAGATLGSVNIDQAVPQEAWKNWRGLNESDKELVDGNKSNSITDHIHSGAFLAKRQRCVEGSGGDVLRSGLPLTQVRRAAWADSCDDQLDDNYDMPSSSHDTASQSVPEYGAFQLKPSVGTWFGLSPEQDHIRRIRESRFSSWDPITLEAVTVGGLVLADTTIQADRTDHHVQECARGIILACDRAMLCKIGFLNKSDEWLTTVTLTLPDDRILQPIPPDDDDSENDAWSEYSE